MGKARNCFYTILDIPNAERVSDCRTGKALIFKTEEAAYSYLLRENFNCYMSSNRSLQILLLVSELAKTDTDIAYKMFLTEKKTVKTFNHVTVMSYLNQNKMFKVAFKAYCDMIAIMGIGRKKICFQHYDITEHPPGTDITTI